MMNKEIYFIRSFTVTIFIKKFKTIYALTIATFLCTRVTKATVEYTDKL